MEQNMKIDISKEELASKILEGLTNDELAKYFNCSSRTIGYRKAKFGLQNLKNKKLSDSIIESIISDFNCGMSIGDIARKYNISETSVRKYAPIEIKVKVPNIKNCACPYCSKLFENWYSVRKHISKCNNNTKSYIISLIYGPIKFKEQDYKKLREEYPLLEKSLIYHISDLLNKQDKFTGVIWDRIKAKEAALSFYSTFNRSPISRDTYKNSSLPSDHWIKSEFGSWNNFINYCGLKTSGYYGNSIKGVDGNTYRSNLELFFVENYLLNKYEYIYEKDYPGNTNRISDFYLPNYDTYIEIAGGLRPEVIKEKIDYCINNKLKLLVLYPRHIYNFKYNLEQLLG